MRTSAQSASLFHIAFVITSAVACNGQTEFAAGPRAGEKPGPLPPSADAFVNPDDPSLLSLEETFAAARFEDAQIGFDPTYRSVSQELMLTESAPATARFRQSERLVQLESFKQGHDGQTATPESFEISTAGKLDLLVVIDDSTSMADEQAKLAAKLDPLLSRIGDTDWQIAVVTTQDPCLRNSRLIKKTDADRYQAFSVAVQPTLDPVAIEKGFPVAIRAIKGECKGVYNPWLRTGSSLAVLVVSDEENCGSNAGEGCVGELGQTAQQMVDYLRTLRPADQARIYAIIEQGNSCGSYAYDGNIYRAAVDATGGTWGSICATSYDTTLQNISDNASRIVKRTFKLKQLPDAGSVSIAVDGVEMTSGFSVSGNTVTLDATYSSAARLVVSYSYGSTPKTSRFALASAADAQTLAVKVNGKSLAASAFAYDSSTREVVLDDEPVDDATIEVSSRGVISLAKDLSLAALDMLGEPLGVKVAGMETSASYDAASKVLSFPAAPSDAAEIEVSYRAAGGRVTSYSASVSGLMNDPDMVTVTAVDKATGEPVDVRLEGDLLIVPAGAVEQGRVLHVAYEGVAMPEDMDIDLGAVPETGSVSVTASADGSSCEGSSLVGSVLQVRCAGVNPEHVSITYRKFVERIGSFVFAGRVPADAKYQVFIDGIEIREFTRDGKTVMVPPALLEANSVVLIRASFPR